MRRLLRIVLLLVLLIIASAIAAVLMAFEDAPLVAEVGRLAPGEVQRAVTLLRANDPRRLKDGQVSSVTLSEEQIALAISYALTRIGPGGAGVRLADSTMQVQISVQVPGNPIGRYLNVAAELAEGDPLPRFQALRIGRVPVPRWLADVAMRQAVNAVHADADARAASEMIHAVGFSPGRMRVAWRWRKATVERLRARLIPEADQLRLRAYNDHLVRVARELSRGADLADLLRPMLELAAQRSVEGEAALENQLALVVLEATVNGRDLTTLVPDARNWPVPRRLSPTLQGRRDFSQHFMTSAVVAALAGTALADAIGIYKEIDDSRGGSGFSFTDLAADRAGTRFGEICVRSAEHARSIQDRARRGLAGTDLMPPARDLPEHMGEAEFRDRYGGLEDVRYKQVEEEIERRLDRLPLYR